MLATVYSAAVYGIEGFRVVVEADLRKTVEPRFEMVGLPEASVKEARVRVTAALRNSDMPLPPAAVTVNFAPADRPKRGTLFDLPIALGLLSSMGQVSAECLKDTVVLGELALDGSVRPVPGVLPIAIHALERGASALVVPRANAREAASVPGLKVVAVEHLRDAIGWLAGEDAPDLPPAGTVPPNRTPDFSDVRGQPVALRAAEIAAAGGHNLLMVGPPGCGKTMIARRMPGILPLMTEREQMEVSQIWSVSRLLQHGSGLLTARPFRAPHHTLSVPAMVGGGMTPMPGEVSIAHNGVLFLDELPEFKRGVLEALRQPLEDGELCIVRGMQRATFPSRVMLVASMNPCPCGWLGSGVRSCRCTTHQVMAYNSRVSGPLLDRIDLQVGLQAVPLRDLQERKPGDASEEIRVRVQRAREVQLRRQKQDGNVAVSNANLDAAGVRQFIRPTEAGMRILELAGERLGLSARSLTRALKVARTIADLAGDERVDLDHIGEAIQYRRLDQKQI